MEQNVYMVFRLFWDVEKVEEKLKQFLMTVLVATMFSDSISHHIYHGRKLVEKVFIFWI